MRYNYRGPKNIINAHVAEEQIHGLVEFLVPKGQNHQAHVGHNNKDVNEQEEDKRRNEGLGGDL